MEQGKVIYGCVLIVGVCNKWNKKYGNGSVYCLLLIGRKIGFMIKL